MIAIPAVTGVQESGGLAQSVPFDLRWKPGWDAKRRWVLVSVGVTFDLDDTAAFFAMRCNAELVTGLLMLYRLNAVDRLKLWCPAPADWDGLGTIVCGSEALEQGVTTQRAVVPWSIDGTKYVQHVWYGFGRDDPRGECP